MGLFRALTKVVVDTALLPVAVAKDVFTLGGVADENGRPHTLDQLEKIKDDAEEADL